MAGGGKVSRQREEHVQPWGTKEGNAARKAGAKEAEGL